MCVSVYICIYIYIYVCIYIYNIGADTQQCGTGSRAAAQRQRGATFRARKPAERAAGKELCSERNSCSERSCVVRRLGPRWPRLSWLNALLSEDSLGHQALAAYMLYLLLTCFTCCRRCSYVASGWRSSVPTPRQVLVHTKKKFRLLSALSYMRPHTTMYTTVHELYVS